VVTRLSKNGAQTPVGFPLESCIPAEENDSRILGVPLIVHLLGTTARVSSVVIQLPVNSKFRNEHPGPPLAGSHVALTGPNVKPLLAMSVTVVST
jgi:hypothetical protein